jgi:hypothetical protein
MYAVLAPIVMSGVALLGSDSFGMRWGPVALLLGPVAYIFFRRRPAATGVFTTEAQSHRGIDD